LPAGFAVVCLNRLLSNAAFRLVYPFLPQISRGLGVSLETMGAALAVRDSVGVVTPVVGQVVDRTSQRTAMVWGLGASALLCTLTAASTNLTWLTLCLAAMVVAKNLHDIGSAAWIGDTVPFARRGRAIGVVETTWAISFVAFMPLAALLIRAGSWRTPFVVLGVLCALAAVALGSTLPASPPRASSTQAPLALTHPVLGLVAAVVFVGIGHQIMLVTFASWLEDEHGVSLEGLGLAAVVVGLSELAGSLAVAVVGDRVGTRRLSLAALALTVPLALLLPLGWGGLGGSLVLLGGWFLGIEAGFVALLPAASELQPEARGRVVGLVFTGFTLGHAAGAVVGTQAYGGEGIALAAVITAATLAAAAGLVAALVRFSAP
jgi:predicted MFS family arabinose efflux permease